MAEIGDVLVKFVANFAEFSTAMQDSQKQLVEFGEQATKTGTNADNFIGLVKKGFAGLGIGALINEAIQYANQIEKAAASTADLARNIGLNTEQVQALQAVAARTGQSFDELVKIGKQNPEWLKNTTEEAKRLGLVMDNEVVKSLKEVQANADEASKRLEVFFSPAVAATKSWVGEALERIANDLKAGAAHEGVIDKIAAILRMLSYGGSAASGAAFQIGEIERASQEAEANLKAL